MSSATVSPKTSDSTQDSNYYSGTFRPSLGRMSDPGQPAFFNQKVWWLSNGKSDSLYLYSGIQTDLLQGDTSQVKKNWSHQKISNHLKSNGLDLKTTKVSASVIKGDRCYFFWRDKKNDRLACMYIFLSYDAGTMTLNSNLCDSAIKIQKNGSTISNLDGDVAAYGLGDEILINFLSSGKLYSAVIDPDQLDEKNATWEVSQLVQSTTLKDLNIKSANNLSGAWFTFGPEQNYVLLNIFDGDKNIAYPFIWKVNSNNYISGNPAKTIGTFSAKYSPSLRCDPAGRIVAIYPKKDSKQYIYTRTFNTLGPSTTASSPQFNDSFSDESKLFGQSHKSNIKVTTVFVTANAVDGLVTVQNENQANQTYSGKTADVYQFAVYGHTDKSDGSYKVTLQCGTYGSLGAAANYASRLPDTQNQGKMLVKAIMDPFPMANDMVNSGNYESKRVFTRYGVYESHSEDRTLALSMQFGVKGNFKTSKGIGPALEYQFKTGPSFRNEWGIETQKETFFESYAGADPAQTGNYNIVPFGELMGISLPTIHEDAQFFFDSNGVQVNGYNTALYSQLRIDPNDSNIHAREGIYQLVSSTPGDLNTYTKDSINENMMQAWNGLSSSEKEEFPAAYGDGTYFQDVILPNAYAFGETDNSDPEKGKYLEYLVGHGGSYQKFTELTKSFREWGWTMDGSFYLGISGGEEFSVMGVGEGFQSEDMVGFEFQSAAALDTREENSWGIDVDIDALLPYNHPYTVRLYLLKASDLWAKEALYMSGSKGDLQNTADLLNSEPMKVFFRVILD